MRSFSAGVKQNMPIAWRTFQLIYWENEKWFSDAVFHSEGKLETGC